MKQCYCSHKTQWARPFIVALLIILTLLLIGLAIGIFLDSPEDWGVALFVALFGVVFFVVEGIWALYLYGEYTLDSDGITVSYLNRIRFFYPWSSITQICLCTLNKHRHEYAQIDVIWCTIGKIRGGPPKLAGRWNESEYRCIRSRSVVTIEYTPERLTEFQQYVDRYIPDYRPGGADAVDD